MATTPNNAALGRLVAELLSATDVQPCSTPITVESVGATGHGDCWMVTLFGVKPGTGDDLRRRAYLRYDGVEISRWEREWQGGDMSEWHPIDPPSHATQVGSPFDRATVQLESTGWEVTDGSRDEIWFTNADGVVISMDLEEC